MGAKLSIVTALANVRFRGASPQKRTGRNPPIAADPLARAEWRLWINSTIQRSPGVRRLDFTKRTFSTLIGSSRMCPKP
jgi:hypothetical protein